MSGLARFLYPLPPASRAPLVRLVWWEQRRFRFNLAVGGAGLFTIGVASLLMALPPNGMVPWFPPVAILVYGLMANVCYTAGWVLETLFNAWWGDQPPTIGPVLFRQGVIFSVGLTLLPIFVAFISWGFRVLRLFG
jgi:hypothetical protein